MFCYESCFSLSLLHPCKKEEEILTFSLQNTSHCNTEKNTSNPLETLATTALADCFQCTNSHVPNNECKIKYNGVSWSEEKKAWRADIRVDRLRHIGSFDENWKAARKINWEILLYCLISQPIFPQI